MADVCIRIELDNTAGPHDLDDLWDLPGVVDIDGFEPVPAGSGLHMAATLFFDGEAAALTAALCLLDAGPPRLVGRIKGARRVDPA